MPSLIFISVFIRVNPWQESAALQRPKARPRARVAHVAVAEPLHLQQHRVVVTIDEDARDLQAIARRVPLGPERVARAAEERREPGRPRLGERLVVHEADHQHLLRRLVLDDCRYEPVEFAVIHPCPSVKSVAVFRGKKNRGKTKKPRRGVLGGAKVAMRSGVWMPSERATRPARRSRNDGGRGGARGGTSAIQPISATPSKSSASRARPCRRRCAWCRPHPTRCRSRRRESRWRPIAWSPP